MASQYKTSLKVYRIADNRHPIFDGNGAALTGGRWNSQGLRAIYASCSYAGAMLEKLAQTSIGSIPQNQQSISIYIPDSLLIEEVVADDIPEWTLENKTWSCKYGDSWLKEKRTPVLIVPSIVVKYERNVLINPEHPEFTKIIPSLAEPVFWDPRLFKEDVWKK